MSVLRSCCSLEVKQTNAVRSASESLFSSSFTQMVMEFPDNVLNLDGHQNNSAQLKQFIQVNISLFYKESHVLLGFGFCRSLPLCL